jgi:branched-chain amino acid transport system ATP-binding protein
MASAAILEVNAVRQEFGGLTALDDVTIAVKRGEIHGLIGPNGAGKSTLINVLTGLYHPAKGSVVLDGREITGMRPDKIYEAGVSRTFQNIRIWPGLSLRDNVMIGAYRASGIRPWDVLVRMRHTERRTDEMKRKSLAALRLFGLEHLADTRAGGLSYGHRKLLEIARACVASPKLLLLDEPAAGLNASEASDLQKRLAGLPAIGTTLVLIEHNMRFVMELCHNVSVLNFGRKLMTGVPAQVQRSTEVIEAYLGSATLDSLETTTA